MQVIDGKKIAKEIVREQKTRIKEQHLTPGLATILIGDNEASKIYINEKRKSAQKMGVYFQKHVLPAGVTESAVLTLIDKLNRDPRITGIIIQFPIPKTFDADTLVARIDPKKDADGFHPENIKKFLEITNLDEILQKNILLPVTPAAIMDILNRVDAFGFVNNPHIVLIGKCSIFIEPLIHYFKLQSADNFEVVSPDDPEMNKKASLADILIAACGRPHFIGPDAVKKGAIVVDVGINRLNGKVVGDIDFERVAKKTSAITPVTGGLGPVTVAVLLRNVVHATKKRT